MTALGAPAQYPGPASGGAATSSDWSGRGSSEARNSGELPLFVAGIGQPLQVHVDLPVLARWSTNFSYRHGSKIAGRVPAPWDAALGRRPGPVSWWRAGRGWRR